MSLEFFNSPRFRLNCTNWHPGSVKRHAGLSQERQAQRAASDLTAEEIERCWRYARAHRVSFAEAVRQLFDEQE